MVGHEMVGFIPTQPSEFIMPDITVPDLQTLSSSPESEVLTAAPELRFIERVPVVLEDAPRNAKDASLQELEDRYLLYASVNRGGTQSGWTEQVYEAQNLKVPVWKLLGEVKIPGIDREFVDEDGNVLENTLCASGAFKGGVLQQERCFGPGGRIHYLIGDDPTNLEYGGVALQPDPEKGIVGLYDAEPVDGLGPRGGVINRETGEEEFLMTVSAVGSFKKMGTFYYPQEGTISLARRSGGWAGEYELLDQPLLTEYQIPGHVPTVLGGEWVPEGGKIMEIDQDTEALEFVHQSRDTSGDWRLELTTLNMDDLRSVMASGENEIRFVHYFTAFIDGDAGARQRGFIGVSSEITQTPVVLGMIKPLTSGETGHGTIHRIKKVAQVDLAIAA